MGRKWVGIIAATVLLAACQPAGGPGLKKGNPYAPGTAATREGGVDGLLVGHRLMAAGEYELALKAYYRAAARQGMTADVLSAIGSANLRLGRLGQAERILRQAVMKDPEFPAAWNNLGVVLMERGNTAEAMEVFKRAYALDSGQSDSIRDNLRLAIEKTRKTAYDAPEESKFVLVRRGGGKYLLLATP